MNVYKILCAALLLVAYSVVSAVCLHGGQVDKTDAMVAAMNDDSGHAAQHLRNQQLVESNGWMAGWIVVALVIVSMFWSDLRRLLKLGTAAAVLLLTLGCYRPFEPVKLEPINSNEEAFLIPRTGDVKKQASSDNEEYLKANLVFSKQVQIPQQWVPKGYETFGANGEWRDAAVLIKVDKSPVTREWTADPNTGTSSKNEAVWVMTSDQVEFSTGWTITARIAGRDDAVKFLHNYPNGSLPNVLDSEVRSKLQAEFGLEVTDLPMDELRKNATPHISRTVKAVSEFFKVRGITITNLGISGGFVYKDPSIMRKLVEVFNAEQERSIAVAKTNAQTELNKSVILKAQGEADAILKTKKAEADGIKLVADARIYEIEKAAQQPEIYMRLKQLELQRELLAKWDGSFPHYFMGTAGTSPNMLLQLPPLENGKK
jgi:regulator of protease activity HflC (stomatin/prohibitin superfamily)